MTRNKDQKRLVRARMKKTGESYTAARAVVVSRKSRVVSSIPREQLAELAGMRDEPVKAKTGRDWAEWVRVLDAAGAHAMKHRDIAILLRDEHGLPPWWTQAVTVGYERIRGLREKGQRSGGVYAASKSRTFAADLPAVYRMFADARRRKSWLPGGLKRMRAAVEGKSIRFDCDDGTQANVYFVRKAPGKTLVSIEVEKLGGKEDIARVKALWHERLDALRDAL